ncbi:hypothetical protein PIB30_044715 [Stylosanthes scabra]|uniref:Uncharacterized protein n=1 Tax=Stylosanthes scabra TaxID=79078 RepID=A0ABU6UF96_9FABA|nr:hypothetical protein [Stylosanthes scabra]
MHIVTWLTVSDVDLFEFKGKETGILKAKDEIDGTKKVRDTLNLFASNHKQVLVGLRYERLGVRARQQTTPYRVYVGSKRHGSGKENIENRKKICVTADKTANSLVEGASREMTPTDP